MEKELVETMKPGYIGSYIRDSISSVKKYIPVSEFEALLRHHNKYYKCLYSDYLDKRFIDMVIDSRTGGMVMINKYFICLKEPKGTEKGVCIGIHDYEVFKVEFTKKDYNF